MVIASIDLNGACETKPYAAAETMPAVTRKATHQDAAPLTLLLRRRRWAAARQGGAAASAEAPSVATETGRATRAPGMMASTSSLREVCCSASARERRLVRGTLRGDWPRASANWAIRRASVEGCAAGRETRALTVRRFVDRACRTAVFVMRRGLFGLCIRGTPTRNGEPVSSAQGVNSA